MCTHMRACACHSVYGCMVPPPLMPAMWESTMYRCAVCAQAPCKRPLTLRRDEGAEVRPFTSPQQHATTMPASPLPTLTCAYVPVAPCLGMYEHCYISAVPCRPEYPLHSVPHQHPAPGHRATRNAPQRPSQAELPHYTHSLDTGPFLASRHHATCHRARQLPFLPRGPHYRPRVHPSDAKKPAPDDEGRVSLFRPC